MFIWLWINTYENTIFSGLFTSINPSYFEVNYRGFPVFDPSPYITSHKNLLLSQTSAPNPWRPTGVDSDGSSDEELVGTWEDWDDPGATCNTLDF